jgi:tetratricopeptide (TPR) repeat protein
MWGHMVVRFFSALAILLISGQVKSASFELPKVNVEIMINADGSLLEKVDLSLRILNDEALKKYKVLKIEYSPELEKFTIESGQIDNGGEINSIDLKNIVESSVAAKDVNGYSHKQVSIIFPNAKINSVIHLKYSRSTNALNSMHPFVASFDFGNQAKEFDTNLKITSTQKIFFKVIDPENVLNIQEKKIPPIGSELHIRLTRPYLSYDENNLLKTKNITAVQVSTSEIDDKVINLFEPAYYATFKKPVGEDNIDIDGPYSVVTKTLVFSSDGSAEVQINGREKHGDVVRFKKDLKNKTNKEAAIELLKSYGPGEQKIIKDFKIDWNKADATELNFSGHYNATYLKKSIVLPDLNQFDILFKMHAEPQFLISAVSIPNIDHTYFLKNAFAVGKEPYYCDIRSEWMNATRSIQYLREGILVKDTVHLHKRDFTEKDLNDENYKLLRGQLKNCFFGNVIQVTFESRKHLVVTKEFEDSLAPLPLKEKLAKRIEKTIEINACCDKTNSMHVDMIRVLLEKNIKDDPTYVPSYQHLSYFYQARDKIDLALKYLNIALSYQSDFTEALISKAVILCRMNKCTEGSKIINEKVLTKDINQFSYFAIRGLRGFYFYLGDKLSEKKYFKLMLNKAETKYQRSEVNDLMSMDSLENGELESCVSYAKKAIEADDDSSCNHFHLGKCYLAQRKYDNAILSVESALSRKESVQFRVRLAQIYFYKAIDRDEKNDPTKANNLINKSFEISNDWRSSLELVKFFFEIKRKEEAFKAAVLATKQFEGDPKVLSGYFIQLFEKKDAEYSVFMKRVINNMPNKFSATEVSYYIAYELQNDPVEMLSWIKMSLDNLSHIKINAEDKDMNVASNLLATRFYLLSLNQTRASMDLLNANEHFELAKKAQPRSKEVAELDHYVSMANHALGRGEILWETRLKLEKYFGIRFPMWLLDMLYGY